MKQTISNDTIMRNLFIDKRLRKRNRKANVHAYIKPVYNTLFKMQMITNMLGNINT